MLVLFETAAGYAIFKVCIIKIKVFYENACLILNIYSQHRDYHQNDRGQNWERFRVQVPRIEGSMAMA